MTKSKKTNSKKVNSKKLNSSFDFKRQLVFFIVFILIPLSLFFSIKFYKGEYKLNNIIKGSKNNSEDMLNVDLMTNNNGVDIRFEEVEYFNGTKGFYVEPLSADSNSNSDENANLEIEVENYPGVIMIHEWWGLNDHIKEQAKILASYGYRVLAVDLFGSVATTSDQAITQVRGLDQQEAIENMTSAIEFLKSRGSDKVASLGWCFGGAQSLQVSLNNDLDGTIIYYGNLVNDSELLANLNSPVLGIFGDEDTQISVESVNNFENNLNELGIDNSINLYNGVGHAFANPSGQNYAEQETIDAWNKTLEFLDFYLK